MGKGKGKTGKTNICVVGSIVGTDDYSWGPSGSVAHYWTHASAINHREEGAQFGVRAEGPVLSNGTVCRKRCVASFVIYEPDFPECNLRKLSSQL